MNNEFFSQMAMQLQSPESITQMASSPYDPWAVMMQLQKKFEMNNGGPLQAAQAPGQQQNLGALLSGGAGLMKQSQGTPRAQIAPPPMAIPQGGRPAPVPQGPAARPVQPPMNIGQLLSRGPGYGV